MPEEEGSKVSLLEAELALHDVERSHWQEVASQTPIEVYSGDDGAHPKAA